MQYKCDNEDSYYKKCLRVCKRYGLEYLFDCCTKFYVTEKGDIRLTFSTRRECVAMLLQAKRSLKADRCFKISVEIMCPRSELETKNKLKQLGRIRKQEGKIQSYDVVQQKIHGVFVLKLRIYIKGVGSRIFGAAQLQSEGAFDIPMDTANKNHEE